MIEFDIKVIKCDGCLVSFDKYKIYMVLLKVSNKVIKMFFLVEVKFEMIVDYVIVEIYNCFKDNIKIYEI